MMYLQKNETDHWVIIATGYELHSGDHVRVRWGGRMVPGRMELEPEAGGYIVIIDGGRSYLPVTAETEISLPQPEMDSTPVTRALDALHIPYRLFRHAGPVLSIEQAAGERGQQPDQLIRSLLFRLEDGSFVLALVAGPQQISWPALRRYLGQSRLTTATPEEVLTITGYPPGAVSPFGLPQPVRTLVDESVLKQDEISIGSGERGAAVLLRKEDLLTALGAVETGKFTD